MTDIRKLTTAQLQIAPSNHGMILEDGRTALGPSRFSPAVPRATIQGQQQRKMNIMSHVSA